MNRSGFTVAELMISMALFSMVAAAVSWLVLSANHSQAGAARVDGAQNALRVAMEYMTRDIQMAGAGVSSGRLYDWRTTPNNVPIFPVQVTNSATDSDEITLITVDAHRYAVLTVDYIPPGPVVGSAHRIWTTDCTNLRGGAGSNFLIQISDLSEGMLRFTQGWDSSTPCTYLGLSYLSPSGVGSEPRQWAQGSYVFAVRWVTYRIDRTTNIPTLVMIPSPGAAAQPLAEGIEDLQIILGIDSNGNGLVEGGGSTAATNERIYDYPGETAPADLSQLRSVEVILVARTSVPDESMAGSGGFPTGATIGDHPLPAPDRYHRRVAIANIAVRSLNL